MRKPKDNVEELSKEVLFDREKNLDKEITEELEKIQISSNDFSSSLSKGDGNNLVEPD